MFWPKVDRRDISIRPEIDASFYLQKFQLAVTATLICFLASTPVFVLEKPAAPLRALLSDQFLRQSELHESLF